MKQWLMARSRSEDFYRPTTFEDNTYRRVAWRFIPFLVLCYLVAYLDRINIGIAKLNMLSDLRFDEATYGLGAGLFFIGYLIFEVPSNLIMYRVGARVWIARILLSWGSLSILTAFVRSPWQFYALRFLLGVAEAGFYPGVILYLTSWFPNHRRASITAIFQAGIPIAGLFGSPLSGWIMKNLNHMWGHPGWQWVFILEALPTVPLAIGAMTILTDRVKDAKWLTAEQRQLITEDIANDNRPREHLALWRILQDRRIWKIILMTFPAMMGLYALGFYLPTLIREAGTSDELTVGWLCAIPYACAVVTMILLSRSSDRLRERRWHLAGSLLLGAFGLITSIIVRHDLMLTVLSLSIASSGIISFSPIMWTLPTAFLGGATAAASIGAITGLGNMGGFVAPYIIGWTRETFSGGSLAIGIIAGGLFTSAMIALSFDSKINRRIGN